MEYTIKILGRYLIEIESIDSNEILFFCDKGFYIKNLGSALNWLNKYIIDTRQIEDTGYKSTSKDYENTKSRYRIEKRYKVSEFEVKSLLEILIRYKIADLLKRKLFTSKKLISKLSSIYYIKGEKGYLQSTFQSEIESAVQESIADGLLASLSDEESLLDYLISKRKYSILELEYKLKEQGITLDVKKYISEKYGDYEYSICTKLIEERKTINYLLRKGFKYNIIVKATKGEDIEPNEDMEY